MARIRTIKPEFFHSLSLAECSTRARLLFIGLWTYCDDEGRAVDEPRIIKGALFPLDDDLTARDVDGDLTALERVGAITRYEVEGKRYLVVCSWHHQKIDRPSKSRIPAPLVPHDDDSSKSRRGLGEDSMPDLGPSTEDQGSRTVDLGADDDDRQHNSRGSSTSEHSSSSDFSLALQVIADVVTAARKGKVDDPEGYARGVVKSMTAERGEEIRSMLGEGMSPQQVAESITGKQLEVRYALRKRGIEATRPYDPDTGAYLQVVS